MRPTHQIHGHAAVRLSLASAILWIASGCEPPSPSVLDTPVRPETVVADLVDQARIPGDMPVPKCRRCATELEVEELQIPQNGEIFVDARISRIDQETADPIGLTRFRIEVDGEQAFAVDLRQERGNHATHRGWATLEPWAGRKVRLTLRIENDDPDNTRAYWQETTLRRRDRVPRRAATDGPNVLFVLVDTLRADHCSLYGYDRPTTPFLDSLAAESRIFDNAISQASWTLPSVASILTGLYPFEHRAMGTGNLHHSQTLFSEVLQAAGWTTVAVSASPVIQPLNGFAQGFETFHHLEWARAPALGDRFGEWLDGHEDVQWLAYLHFMEPHDPYDAPAPARGKFTDPNYDGLFTDPAALNEIFFTLNFGLEPARAFTPADIEHLKGAYDEEILLFDQELRRIVEDLERRGLWQRTILVLVSDHGEEFTEHGMLKHGSQLYIESVRVPLLVRAPGRVAPGRVRQPVETRQVFRTVLQLLRRADSPPRPNDLLLLDEHSPALPTFSYMTYPVAPRNFVDRHTMASIYEHPWKLIWKVESNERDLFELDADPGELLDRASSEKAMTRHYSALLKHWKRAGAADQAQEPAEDTVLDAAMIEQLRALGYLQ